MHDPGSPPDTGTAPADTTELEATLALQRAAYLAHPVPSIDERREDLRQLARFVREHREAIVAAIAADYGHRSRHETLFAEIVTVLDGVEHALKHLKLWMKPQRRPVDWSTFPGARNRVIAQPLGVVGVIVPWNFPLNLSLLPLVSIFAAGNRAMVKMSENSRHLAHLMLTRLPQYFPRQKLAVFDETGGVGIAFSQLPFDHLLFTGSGVTGRSVMAAAARNLCPVTLELGGKSPAVICDDYPLAKAAERILFVKLFNAGQICTTVDHVFVPEHRVGDFVELARRIVPARYPRLDSPDLTAVIDARAFGRITAALAEAETRGASVIPLLPGPRWDESTRRIAPHLVLDLPADCELATREIFGPVLPVYAYTALEDVIQRINAQPRPLAFYPFSNDRTRVQLLIERVISGGVSINDALFHVAQHDLPFGGVGASGMGHYHGHEGFLTFSKLRPVFRQARFSPLKFLAPPYGRLATTILEFLSR
ncbi:MAG: Coniferyl aldehyde dehydrogenase [Pseudomonadales bacterium]|nr:Coniferyl aldehyde dehydrogenase [Pseudomonadales bacterium]